MPPRALCREGIGSTVAPITSPRVVPAVELFLNFHLPRRPNAIMTAFWLKRLSSTLPLRAQQRLKQLQFAHQIRSDTFVPDEPEFAHLDEWVSAGDWVIDVGANVGHYTAQLSRLVGPAGRVLAFEPVPETFELLAANMGVAGARNVTLVNAAASAEMGSARVSLPQFSSGLTNYYRAGITSEDGDLSVLMLPLDNLIPSARVTLVKVDVEGYEYQALRGMRGLLCRDRPRLIVEGGSTEVETLLEEFGYSFTEFPGSPNRVFTVARK